MSRLAYILLLATLMSGCASLPNKATAQIDNRRVALSGKGEKTVVFESGLAIADGCRKRWISTVA